jgi:hypothetical protein
MAKSDSLSEWSDLTWREELFLLITLLQQEISSMNRRAVRPERLVWSMVAMAITAPVWAHHSGAGYDMTKTLTAEATLKEFRWGAPHSAAVFMIKGPDGKSEVMTVGAGGPGMFFKQGFKPRDFQVGDKMEISWHPSTSGQIGGLLASMKLPDGREFKDVEFAPGGVAADQVNTAQ